MFSVIKNDDKIVVYIAANLTLITVFSRVSTPARKSPTFDVKYLPSASLEWAPLFILNRSFHLKQLIFLFKISVRRGR